MATLKETRTRLGINQAEIGNLVETLSLDPWGRRRNPGSRPDYIL
jgi:hypothetical protein